MESDQKKIYIYIYIVIVYHCIGFLFDDPETKHGVFKGSLLAALEGLRRAKGFVGGRVHLLCIEPFIQAWTLVGYLHWPGAIICQVLTEPLSCGRQTIHSCPGGSKSPFGASEDLWPLVGKKGCRPIRGGG